jgi:ABC-type dipeptide/oligopeptide/nickel transport system permease component
MFIFRRTLVALPVCFFVLVVTFAMLQLVPGNAVDVIAGPQTTPEVAAQLKHELGLDQPLPVQFVDYVKNVLHGNLGTSFVQGESVSTIIGQHLPYTLELVFAGVLLGFLCAVPLGFAGALSQIRRRHPGIGFAVFTTGLAATPDFLLGTLLALVFAVYLGVLPVAGADGLHSLILPAVALAIPVAGVQSRVVRTSVLETLAKPYVRTLRAAGLAERRILLRTVLPNSMIPVITVLSVDFGRLLAGALIVENVFAWPGLGTTIFQSISSRDLPAVQGEILVLALLVIFVNLVVDVLYRVLDPRITV